MKLKFAFALLGAVAVSLTACVRQAAKPVYFAFQLNSKEEIELAQDILHQTKRKIGATSDIVIDVMEQKRLINLYSDKAKGSSLRELMDSLKEYPSEPSAIVQAVNRAARFEDASAIVVTPGTCDPASLKALSEVSKNIPPATHLFVIGVSPQNRLCMSQAFTAIRDRVKFASTDEEWISVINQL